MAKGAIATQLTGLLSGSAIEAFKLIPTKLARRYDAVKEATLARFQVNAETYRRQFRGTRCCT